MKATEIAAVGKGISPLAQPFYLSIRPAYLQIAYCPVLDRHRRLLILAKIDIYIPTFLYRL